MKPEVEGSQLIETNCYNAEDSSSAKNEPDIDENRGLESDESCPLADTTNDQELSTSSPTPTTASGNDNNDSDEQDDIEASPDVSMSSFEQANTDQCHSIEVPDLCGCSGSCLAPGSASASQAYGVQYYWPSFGHLVGPQPIFWPHPTQSPCLVTPTLINDGVGTRSPACIVPSNLATVAPYRSSPLHTAHSTNQQHLNTYDQQPKTCMRLWEPHGLHYIPDTMSQPIKTANESRPAISYIPTVNQHYPPTQLQPQPQLIYLYLTHYPAPSNLAWQSRLDLGFYPYLMQPPLDYDGAGYLQPTSAPNINHTSDYYCQPAPIVFEPTGINNHQTVCHNRPNVAAMLSAQRRRFALELISMLPIDARPALTRQAYGMDRVWEDEFEQMFCRLDQTIVWHLMEVETNPSIRESDSIIAHRGHYIVRSSKTSRMNFAAGQCCVKGGGSVCESDTTNEDERDYNDEEIASDRLETEDAEQHSSDSLYATASSLSCESGSGNASDSEPRSEICADSNSSSGASSSGENQTDGLSATSELSHEILLEDHERPAEAIVISSSGSNSSNSCNGKTDRRKFPLRFRMFIDSAKVRFCCDYCGHGWTSMKGRVVFWYELFEVQDCCLDGGGSGQMLGFCGYKLFGQQCDVCKIKNRFERPMWYPEEVTKVLNNLCNKIGQVYFGLRASVIDKQRRAGKPKTSHNSSLCQACHDGVCTDRK